MAYSANGNNFPSKTLSRVKYDLEYDSNNDLYRFKGKPQEVIKVCNAVAVDIFFDTAADNTPIWFDSSSLNYLYGNQIFIDVAGNKNLIILDSPIILPCLNIVKTFVNFV